jgi:hypothetical protein
VVAEVVVGVKDDISSAGRARVSRDHHLTMAWRGR